MSEVQETEITLGTGRLLVLFFGLVMVCAVFFGLGFALGRNSGTVSAAPIIQGPAAAVTPIPAPTAAKPTAVKTTAAAECPQGQTCDTAPSTSDELAFYKSAPSKDKEAAAATHAEPQAAPGPPAEIAASGPATAAAAPEMAKASAAPQPGFVVQIAAVSKKEDAETLVGALRKKNYPVFVAANTADHLFHVQVGPFSERKDAQTMRDKLAGDGYSPIVK